MCPAGGRTHPCLTPFSVSSFLRCCLTHLMVWIKEWIFDTALKTLSSTSEGFKAKTKVKTDIVNEFLFVNDCALNATTKANMQNNVYKFSMAREIFGLTISTKKTSDAPANAWKTRRRAQHHNQRTTTERGRKVHLPRQHPFIDDTRLAKASTAFGWLCGIGEVSRTQSKRYTELSFLPPFFMAMKRGQLIHGI